MAVARGSCPQCKKPLAYLKEAEDGIVLVVGCHSCQTEYHFDLATLVAALEDSEPSYEQMLHNFHPTGRPN